MIKQYLVALTALVPVLFAQAASSTELTDDAVASVGTINKPADTTYYTDLQEAFTALAKGTATAKYELKLLKDVTLTEGLEFKDANTYGDYPSFSGRYEYFLVDLGGHTITLENGSKPLLTTIGNMYSSLGIRNGSLVAKGTTPGALDVKTCWVHIIGVTMSSESTTPTCRFHDSFKNWNGALKDCRVTNTAVGGVAVEVDGFQGFFHSSTFTAEQGTALYVDQQRDDLGGIAVATSTLEAEVAVGLAATSARDVYLTGGTIKGALRDPNAHLYICGGTYSVDPTEFVGSGYEVVNNGDGTYTISDAAAIQIDGVNADMATAFDLTGVSARTIKLNGDVFLIGLEEKKDLIAVGEGQNITIDLNGHDINIFDVSASFSNVNCGSVKKDGVLTITDSSGEDSGRLTFAAWMMDFRNVPGYANNMFTLGGTSVMNVESGILENQSRDKCAWTYATYCVDVHDGSTLNVTGGKIVHANTAIRMFFGNTAKLTMTGGEVNGGNSTLWVQGGTVDVSITGGKLVGLVNDGSNGSIYTSSNPSGQVLLGGTLESIGNIYSFSPSSADFIKITGGVFIDGGSNYELYGSPGKNAMEITGGVFDRSYMNYRNNFKYWPGYETYYYEVIGSIRIEEDERYHFGEPIAELVDWEPMGNYVYEEKLPYVYEAYSSLPLALAHAGECQYVMQNYVAVFGCEARLNADDPDAKPHFFGDDLDLGFDIYLNGHTVTSTSTEPLISVTNGFTTALNFVNEGTIQSAGPVLKLNDQAFATFYDGLYLTSGATLFDATSAQLKIPVNTAAVGEPFNLNCAGFSHDMSASVENIEGALPFVTRKSQTDGNWYLARQLQAE